MFSRQAPLAQTVVRSLLVASLLGLGSLASSAKSLEEAAKDLESDDFDQRKAAEVTLRKGGADALPLLKRLGASDNPEVRRRSMRARAWIELGITEGIVEDLRNRLLGMEGVGFKARQVLLREVAALTPKEPVLMAHLHSRIHTKPVDGLWQAQLEQEAKRHLELVLRNSKFAIARFDPRLLHVRTQAAIMNVHAQGNRQPASSTYTKWLARDKSLRRYLGYGGVELELRRLQRSQDHLDALVFLTEVEDSQAHARALTSLRSMVLQKGELDPLALTERQAAGYLHLLMDRDDPKKILATYKQLHAKNPKFATLLRPSQKILEVSRLLEENAFYKAFELAMSTQGQGGVRRSGLLEVGQWAASHPDRLNRGLPPLPQGWNSNLGPFIDGLAPIRSSTSDAEAEAIARRFSELDLRSPRVGAWLSQALKGGQYSLYVHTMIVRGQVKELIQTLAEQQSGRLLPQVGKVLAQRPELCRKLEAKTFSAQASRQILEGFWLEVAEPDVERLALADETARRWEAVHPDLLDAKETSNLDPLWAFRLWRGGMPREAITLLAADDRNHYRNAGCLTSLWELEVEVDAKVFQDLDQETLPAKFLREVVERTLKRTEWSSHQVRLALTLSQIVRSRDPENREPGGISHHSARMVAYSLWRQGQLDLGFRVMEEAFWGALDPEERYFGLFPELALLLGRMEEALKGADSVDLENGSERDKLRKAYLLAAAGRSREAVAFAEATPKSKLYQRLLEENGQWKVLTRLPATTKERPYRQAWYAYLDGDFEQGRRHHNDFGAERPHSILQLLLGDYNAVVVKEYRQRRVYQHQPALARRMAREHYLLALCEDELMAALEEKKAIPYQAMYFYFEDAALVPNRERALALAQQLAAMPQSSSDHDPWFRNEDWRTWAHKILAVQALVRLGRRDLAVEQARAVLGDRPDLSELPSYHRRVLFQALLDPGLWSGDSFLKLASRERPKASAAELLEYLAALIHEPNLEKRLAALWDLSKRHGEVLDAKDGALFNKMMAALEKRWRGKEQPPAPGFTSPQWKMTSPRPGKRFDPMADDFVIVDGIARARDLWKDKKENEARVLMKKIVLRVLLDDGFIRQKSKFRMRDTVPGRNSTRSFEGIPQESALICFSQWGLPAELTMPAIHAFLHMPINHASDRPSWAANVYAGHGEYQKALQVLRTYHRGGGSYSPRGADAFDKVSRLLSVEALAAIQKGAHEEALAILRRYLQINPHELRPIAEVRAKLRTAGDHATVEKLDSMIAEFWKSKLLRLPTHEGYQHTLRAWQALAKAMDAE